MRKRAERQSRRSGKHPLRLLRMGRRFSPRLLVLLTLFAFVCFPFVYVLVRLEKRLFMVRQEKRLFVQLTPPFPPVFATSRDAVAASDMARVDILSIGSRTRPEYMQAQRRTWASHPSIHNFFEIDESVHDDYGGCQGIEERTRGCKSSYRTIRGQPPGVMEGKFWANQQAGWLCAQSRPAIALGDVVRETYLPQGQAGMAMEADWLLVVDDDTLFRMDIFQNSVSGLPPSEVFVLSGQLFNMEDNEVRHFWPWGGAGLALSRGALKRLYTPVHCTPTPPISNGSAGASDDDRAYQAVACEALERNMAFERDYFEEGMSLAELILTLVTTSNTLCWHSDWLWGYFFSSYLLMGHSISLFPECRTPLWYDVYKRSWPSFLSSLIFPGSGPQRLSCNPEWCDIELCTNPNVMMCHHQGVEDMENDHLERTQGTTWVKAKLRTGGGPGKKC